MKYKSVIGFGRVFFIDSNDEKKEALNVLMKKYSGQDSFSYADDALDKVFVVGIKIETISGKQSG